MNKDDFSSDDDKKLTLVIASKNIHKIREIKSILNEVFNNIDILSLRDFPNYVAPKENGLSFEENALLKAAHAAKELKHLVIADDSGLVVPSLNGEPGIFSARYAGENATDAENRKKLLEKLKNLKEKDRYAFFECCIALASEKNIIKSSCASCEGKIELEEKGGSGFGYDPIFTKHDYNQTFAQLKESIKNKVSHRRKALDKIMPSIESLLVK